jgi:hypothetical protein
MVNTMTYFWPCRSLMIAFITGAFAVLATLAFCEQGDSGATRIAKQAAETTASLKSTTTTTARPTAKRPYSGGDGSSKKSAVIIHAKNTMEGVQLESEWLEEHYPRYELQRQALVGDDTKGKPKSNPPHMYDRMDIKLPNGKEQQIYFDITEFYGKF